MSRFASRFASRAAALLPLLLALACGEGQGVGDGPVEDSAFTAPDLDVPPADVRVFLREAHDSVGPGRRMVHALVPPDASRDALRSAVVQLLKAEAAQDSTLVAVRAVVYTVGEPVAGETGPEAGLEPVAWAEWLPVEGWWGEGAMPASPHKVYTYLGVPPEW